MEGKTRISIAETVDCGYLGWNWQTILQLWEDAFQQPTFYPPRMSRRQPRLPSRRTEDQIYPPTAAIPRRRRCRSKDSIMKDAVGTAGYSFNATPQVSYPRSYEANQLKLGLQSLYAWRNTFTAIHSVED